VIVTNNFMKHENPLAARYVSFCSPLLPNFVTKTRQPISQHMLQWPEALLRNGKLLCENMGTKTLCTYITEFSHEFSCIHHFNCLKRLRCEHGALRARMSNIWALFVWHSSAKRPIQVN